MRKVSTIRFPTSAGIQTCHEPRPLGTTAWPSARARAHRFTGASVAFASVAFASVVFACVAFACAEDPRRSRRAEWIRGACPRIRQAGWSMLDPKPRNPGHARQLPIVTDQEGKRLFVILQLDLNGMGRRVG